jgi:hypothetical protein
MRDESAGKRPDLTTRGTDMKCRNQNAETVAECLKCGAKIALHHTISVCPYCHKLSRDGHRRRDYGEANEWQESAIRQMEDYSPDER